MFIFPALVWENHNDYSKKQKPRHQVGQPCWSNSIEAIGTEDRGRRHTVFANFFEMFSLAPVFMVTEVIAYSFSDHNFGKSWSGNMHPAIGFQPNCNTSNLNECAPSCEFVKHALFGQFFWRITDLTVDLQFVRIFNFFATDGLHLRPWHLDEDLATASDLWKCPDGTPTQGTCGYDHCMPGKHCYPEMFSTDPTSSPLRFRSRF